MSQKKRKPKPVRSPLLDIAARHDMGENDSFMPRLAALLHLDRFLSDKADNISIDVLIECMVSMQIVASHYQKREMYDESGRAIVAMTRACETAWSKKIPTLTPSTSQRKAIVPVIHQYLKMLPKIPIGLYIVIAQKASGFVDRVNASSLTAEAV